jgi:hypothetical protein
MSVLSRNRWLNRLAVVLVAGVSLAATTLPTAPAQARVFVGVGIPFPGAWGYYAPPPYYAYSHYGYPYYGYPAYAYPGGIFIGGTFGPHRHHHRW